MSRLMKEVEDPSPLDYNATLDRMEPGIAPVDVMISLASIAISMKQIRRDVERISIDAQRTASSAANHENLLRQLGTNLDYLRNLQRMR